MQQIAHNLTKSQIEAVAAYLNYLEWLQRACFCRHRWDCIVEARWP